MIRSLVLIPVLFLACACGSAEQPATTSTTSASSNPKDTAVTVTVRASSHAEPKTFELRCEPTGGNHPNAKAACEALLSADPQVFEPVPGNKRCTMQMGGPESGSIVGTVRGEPVDATFKQNNGCEISRFAQVAAVFEVS